MAPAISRARVDSPEAALVVVPAVTLVSEALAVVRGRSEPVWVALRDRSPVCALAVAETSVLEVDREVSVLRTRAVSDARVVAAVSVEREVSVRVPALAGASGCVLEVVLDVVEVVLETEPVDVGDVCMLVIDE
ncbi:MAG TPA: hypothetical protein VFL57_01490, partial [Bryobacteraceae bacterium]|nr:hypothetical protein [Bryobacteraceae bacterium]